MEMSANCCGGGEGCHLSARARTKSLSEFEMPVAACWLKYVDKFCMRQNPAGVHEVDSTEKTRRGGVHDAEPNRQPKKTIFIKWP